MRFLLGFRGALFVSVVLGFLFFWLPPFVAGVIDPWDQEVYFYLSVGIILFLGFLFHRFWWLCPVGIFVGGFIHLLFLLVFFSGSEGAVWWQLGLIVRAVIVFPSTFLVCGIGRILYGVKSSLWGKGNTLSQEV
ncbi:MAG: hypothetical protein WAT81_03100 [Candidatus Moraniibacteriota bacterium]